MAEYRDQWDDYVDKASAALQSLLSDAQDTIAQGKRSLDEYQVRRETERLLARLGAAVFAERRGGGEPAAVEAALAGLDAHVARHGWTGMPPEAVIPPAAEG